MGMDRKIAPLVPSREEGLRVVVGPGKKRLPGQEGMVALEYPAWNAETDDMPFSDHSVVEIHAYHVLEHFNTATVLRFLRETERVLRRDGRSTLNICVPYWNSALAFQDLDHKTWYTEETWQKLFSNPYYAKYGEWKLTVGTNVIMGVVGRNLCLLTQLIRTKGD